MEYGELLKESPMIANNFRKFCETEGIDPMDCEFRIFPALDDPEDGLVLPVMMFTDKKVHIWDKSQRQCAIGVSYRNTPLEFEHLSAIAT